LACIRFASRKPDTIARVIVKEPSWIYRPIKKRTGRGTSVPILARAIMARRGHERCQRVGTRPIALLCNYVLALSGQGARFRKDSRNKDGNVLGAHACFVYSVSYQFVLVLDEKNSELKPVGSSKSQTRILQLEEKTLRRSMCLRKLEMYETTVSIVWKPIRKRCKRSRTFGSQSSASILCWSSPPHRC
jgi:hypothetical protein